jgi:hypothetical protein
MNIVEAQAIADIIREADGGCSVCVEHLRQACEGTFHEFNWEYREATDLEKSMWDFGPHILVTEKND